MTLVSHTSNVDDVLIKSDYKAWRLFTTDDIECGEELTLAYTFYKIEKKKDFLEEAEKEKKELEASYQESARQTKERK